MRIAKWRSAKTIRELRYNLGEAYQDADRHIEAHEIFTELYAADPDEQRFAVRLFVSCQALGMHDGDAAHCRRSGWPRRGRLLSIT